MTSEFDILDNVVGIHQEVRDENLSIKESDGASERNEASA
jgi:hypothetical protein